MTTESSKKEPLELLSDLLEKTSCYGRNSLVLGYDHEDGFFLRKYSSYLDGKVVGLKNLGSAKTLIEALGACMESAQLQPSFGNQQQALTSLSTLVQIAPVVLHRASEDAINVGLDMDVKYNSGPVLDDEEVCFDPSDRKGSEEIGGIQRGTLMSALSAAIAYERSPRPRGVYF